MYTLWIEKLTDEKHSILTLIGNVEKGIALSDDAIQKVDFNFAVRSFPEFIQKFSPMLYAYIDFENGRIEFSRTRRMESTGNKMEEIHLFTENGHFQRILQWIEDLHQGKILALSQEEKLDWFYYDMRHESDRFVRERKQLLEENASQEAWNDFFTKYDKGLFLLRRFAWLVEIIMNGNAGSPLLRDRKDCQLRLLISAASISETGTRQEITEVKNKIQVGMSACQLRHRELLYWNCVMDLEADRLSRDAEFIKRQQEIIDFYQAVLEAFWEEATPMLHSMFEIKKFLESSGRCLLIGNCDVEDLNLNLPYVCRFLDTVNAKEDQTYLTRQIQINGLHKYNENKKLTRLRFQGKSVGEQHKDYRWEEVLNFCKEMQKMQVETHLQYVEDQTEDIYEFLSRN